MKKSEIIKIWRLRLKEELESLSNLDRQKEIWVERKYPNIWWEWNESINDYFNILNINKRNQNESVNHYLKEKFLTQEQISTLKYFNKILEEFSIKTKTPESTEEYIKLLSDPEWIRITKIAKDILTKIDFDTLPEDQK